MNLFQYVYPELFIFFGFLFYFTYNIFSYYKITLINFFYGYDKMQVLHMETFLHPSALHFKKFLINFNLFLEKSVVYQRIKYYVSEKNSFFYIAILCFFTCCLYITQLFWFCEGYGQATIFGSIYVVDTFSIFFKLLITFLAFFFFIVSHHVSEFWKFYGFEFGFFIFMVIFSMLLLASASDFFLVFVSLEVQTLSIVILCSYQMTQKRSIEGGLKYFIYSSFFSGIFLLAISLLYYIFGTVTFEGIQQLTLGGTTGDLVRDNIFMLAIVLLSCLIFFKLGIFPYHYWVADVYQGSNLIVTSFLAIISKIGLISVFIRMYLNMFINFSFFMGNLVFYVSLFSMLFGAIAALFQKDIKRFLAYTSISNLGYTLLTISIGNFDGVVFGLVFFIGYLISTLCLFLILLGVVYKNVPEGEDPSSGSFLNNMYDFNYLVTLDDFKGLYRNNKLLSFGVLIAVLNLLGMPPLMFFFSKYFVFDTFLRYNYTFAVIAFVVTNLISTYYYLRIIKIVFLDRVVTNKLFVFSSKKISFIFIFFIVFLSILAIHPIFLIHIINFVTLVVSLFYR